MENQFFCEVIWNRPRPQNDASKNQKFPPPLGPGIRFIVCKFFERQSQTWYVIVG